MACTGHTHEDDWESRRLLQSTKTETQNPKSQEPDNKKDSVIQTQIPSTSSELNANKAASEGQNILASSQGTQTQTQVIAQENNDNEGRQTQGSTATATAKTHSDVKSTSEEDGNISEHDHARKKHQKDGNMAGDEASLARKDSVERQKREDYSGGDFGAKDSFGSEDGFGADMDEDAGNLEGKGQWRKYTPGQLSLVRREDGWRIPYKVCVCVYVCVVCVLCRSVGKAPMQNTTHTVVHVHTYAY
jgi:hypothetical protein